ncbi:hypothetical protein [Leisingera sp. MMG026]|uniref:hypothetical protein n=1 Tax=Leisingera sp. MMG026 TaxID=2909982 RepID=UPI001F3F604E|nr:hypothetical protein [Leisingera sp. MMG026]MCF6431673.1 hypothetical protein [Leisingera sp. MMG026]
MSVIDEIMRKDSSTWIDSQIIALPDRGKFRASSALRSLQWANGIFDAGMPIPACFCALHATEEAVAAFVSCAKECGYDEAKKINIKDHMAKATVSLLAQKVSGILFHYQVAVALNVETQTLAARYIVDGETHYTEASTKLFHFRDHEAQIMPDFYDEVVNMFGDVAELKKAVKIGQEARNAIFYASSDGYPTGFDDPSESLARECQLTLGLIWGAIDLTKNAGQKIPFIEQALVTANRVIAELKR